ncbi:MAG: hypothetical protein GYA26_02340 [Flexilinea flocculi]|jgi:hypothetical protein|nr:hypothetical protein [Flexilinea flocculi]
MENKNWKLKTLLLGAGIGLFTGLIMAYIKIQRAESKHEMIQFNSKDTAKVGLAVVEILKKLI